MEYFIDILGIWTPWPCIFFHIHFKYSISNHLGNSFWITLHFWWNVLCHFIKVVRRSKSSFQISSPVYKYRIYYNFHLESLTPVFSRSGCICCSNLAICSTTNEDLAQNNLHELCVCFVVNLIKIHVQQPENSHKITFLCLVLHVSVEWELGQDRLKQFALFIDF